jgi:nucleoside-diphosphate-sugar epimerase
MKVVVFVGSGRTGKALIVQLLARGHEVTAVVRPPRRLRPRLRGDEGRRGRCAEATDVRRGSRRTGCGALDAGRHGFLNSLQPMTFYRDSARAMIERMRARRVRRLVLVSSVGVLDEPAAPVWYRALIKPLLRHKYADMRAMEDLVAASGLD